MADRLKEWKDLTFQNKLRRLEAVNRNGVNISNWAGHLYTILNDNQIAILAKYANVNAAGDARELTFAFVKVAMYETNNNPRLLEINHRIWGKDGSGNWQTNAITLANELLRQRAEIGARMPTTPVLMPLRPDTGRSPNRRDRGIRGRYAMDPVMNKYVQQTADTLFGSALRKGAGQGAGGYEGEAQDLAASIMSEEAMNRPLSETFPSGKDYAKQMVCSEGGTKGAKKNGTCSVKDKQEAAENQDESVKKMERTLDEARLQYGDSVVGWVKGMLTYYRSIIVQWIRSNFKSTAEQRQRFDWKKPSTYIPRALRATKDVMVEILIWLVSSARLWYAFMTGLLYVRNRICEYIAVKLNLYKVQADSRAPVTEDMIKGALMVSMDSIRGYMSKSISTLIGKVMSFVTIFELSAFGSNYTASAISILSTFFADSTELLISTWFYKEGTKKLLQIFVAPCVSEIVAYNVPVEKELDPEYDRGIVQELLHAFKRGVPGHVERETLIDRAMRFLPGQVQDPRPEEMAAWSVSTQAFWERLKSERATGVNLYEKYNYHPPNRRPMFGGGELPGVEAEPQSSATGIRSWLGL